MLTFDEFRDRVLLSIRAVGDAFDEADDDWIPMLFISRPGSDEIATGSIGPYFTSTDRKNFLAEVALPMILAASEVKMAALLSSAWIVAIPLVGDPGSALTEAERLSRTGISADPRRTEILMCEVAMRERTETYWATIQRRTDGPPLLGAWEKRDQSQAQGRMVNVVQRALLTVR